MTDNNIYNYEIKSIKDQVNKISDEQKELMLKVTRHDENIISIKQEHEKVEDTTKQELKKIGASLHDAKGVINATSLGYEYFSGEIADIKQKDKEQDKQIANLTLNVDRLTIASSNFIEKGDEFLNQLRSAVSNKDDDMKETKKNAYLVKTVIAAIAGSVVVVISAIAKFY